MVLNMRKYLVLFNYKSKYQDNYAEIEALNSSEAYFSALRIYGNVAVSNVIPANTYGYNLVKLFGKTKLQDVS